MDKHKLKGKISKDDEINQILKKLSEGQITDKLFEIIEIEDHFLRTKELNQNYTKMELAVLLSMHMIGVKKYVKILSSLGIYPSNLKLNEIFVQWIQYRVEW